MMQKVKIKRFSHLPEEIIQPPNLIEAQLNSYQWFVREGLRELFEEISPVKDYSEKEFNLWFDDYYFDEPKKSEIEAKERGVSFEAPLVAKVRLENKKTKEEKIQEVYLGDFPAITARGTFIVNGVERVVVSQIIRSSGVFFTASKIKRKNYFGAKIIPNRGAWIEFETDLDGSINVRIDRKRKVPATALLKVFGIESNDEIKKNFKDIDTGEIKYIEETLKRDNTKNASEAFIELYRRIRPGDLATVENAKQLIETMFFDFSRYDLSKVGRYKFLIRLYNYSSEEAKKKKIKKEERLLNKEDLIAIIKEIILLNNNPSSHPDDIDHLSNRRVRSVGELLQNRLRNGLMKMERIIRDRMSTLDPYTLTPSQLINPRQLIAAVKEFFTISQLSQFMDQINPLAELEHKRRLSAMGPGGLTRERAGFEVRDVHPSSYGRICPIETPEGQNIGLVGHLSTYARINEYGFIETPYRKVKNGRITDEIIYLTALEEEKFNIAHAGISYDKNGKILEERVEARIKGMPGLSDRDKVDLIDISPKQGISVATSLIPFLEHDDANRALMGSNMQKQAVSCIRPQIPLVATGIEKRAATDSGQVVLAKSDGIVVDVDANKIVVKASRPKSKTRELEIYKLHSFVRSNQYSCISQRPIVQVGDKIKVGDVLADGASTKEGMLALGQNLVVAFISFQGANFEDAIILSERVVQNDLFTSIHIEDFFCDVRDTKLGPEITTPDIPNVGEDKLKDLDEEGIVRIGAEVDAQDILVGKISPKGEADLTSEERLLRVIFGEKSRDIKDTSLKLDYGKRGRVIGVRIFSRDHGDRLDAGVIKKIQIEIAQLRKISVGDKLAGRHGNKGVISKILPVEDMPYLEDGTPIDIILNPLSVASRMNLGQILETHLGWAAGKLGFIAETPALAGASETDIKEELKKAGLPESGKITLYDGKTGEFFMDKVTVGQIYIMKLDHMVEDKLHMRSIGPYSLITQQPLGGKAQFGGQRFGEMEVWALEGHGAAYSLQEMLTIKSDDVAGRTAAYDAIIRGEQIKSPNVPSSFHVLVNELKGLGLSVELVGSKEEKKEEKEEEERRIEKRESENKN